MKLRQFSQLFSLLIISLTIIPIASTLAVGGDLIGFGEQDEKIERRRSIRSNQQITASITSIINFPIIEQHSITTTPIPPSDQFPTETEVEIITSTPTSTPIPVQTGNVNIPIVFGALGIILVIIAAWFIVGYLPAKGNN